MFGSNDAVIFIAVIGLLSSRSISTPVTDTKSCKDLAHEPVHPEAEPTCHIDSTDKLSEAFSSVRITVDCQNCEAFLGDTLEDIQNTQSLFNKFTNGVFNILSGKQNKSKSGPLILHVSPYVDKYVQIRSDGSSKTPEASRMKVDTVLDATCVAFLITGTILFFSAHNLATSVKFYYTGGVGIGVIASILIIVFILSRYIPKKPAAYSILVGGWGLAAWMMRLLWHNWQTLLIQYYAYFIGYIITAGFLSFALCYWKGPVEDPRSQRIIQWTIQLFALFLLYNSSQLATVSFGVIFGILFGYFLLYKPDFNVVSRIRKVVKYIWSKPEPPRLLTEEEYRIQAEVETKKALEELKQFCNSPQCSPWKTLSRIKKPERFISFMEGEDHVSEAEATLHANEMPDTDSEDEGHSGLISEDEQETEELNRGDNNANVTNGKRTLHFRDPNISEDED